MKTTREIVLGALNKMDEDKAYSNLTIDKLLSESDLSLQDRSFSSALFYGILERKLTLDYCIQKYSKIPLKKISHDVLNVLRMGIYQIVFMQSVPDSAAVNESVRLTYSIRKVSAKGFVNAVLRNFIRNGKKIDFPDKQSDFIGYYSMKYSCPEWLFNKWVDEYGKDAAIHTVKSSIGMPPLYLRVNSLKITEDELIDSFEKRKREASKTEVLANCISIKGIGSIENLPQYKKGFFHVQDLSSQMLCNIIHPKPNETIFDMCSAPGGKAFTIAQYMQDKGQILAFDLYESRINLIQQSAQRLGLECIKTSVNDATLYNENLGLADKVLCDVVCSGLGIIRRKPEIKYKDPEEFEKLPQIQYNILLNSSKYVKEGGMLIYSTCTLNKKENEEVVLRFLSENKDFEPLQIPQYENYMHTFLPQEINSDGFFVATLIKKW
ncbi:MAG: ribosomal small subunit methyltransferase RsmB [Oscillospiraceae bacterium]|nr:ribosomal small subunit methyltransferase RsmB [Oscillospiraceae bacterium]